MAEREDAGWAMTMNARMAIVGKREESYVFTNVETLIRDFLADVERWRSE
jgi:hypothetical protein